MTHQVTERRDRAAVLVPSRWSGFATVLAQSVLDRWVVPAVVGALMVGMGLLTGSLWPSLESTLRDVPSGLNDNLGKALAGGDLTTGPGWTNLEFLSLVAPLSLIAVAIMSAAGGVPGEEESKTMGPVLSAPLSRSTFLAAKLAAVLIRVGAVSVLVTVGLVLGDLVGDLGLSASGIVGATMHLALLAGFFGAVGVLVGAATGNRRLTLAITAGSVAASFVATVVLPLVDALDELARLSPWYYLSAAEPLTQGAEPGHLLVLVVLTALAAALAVRSFARRDLRG